MTKQSQKRKFPSGVSIMRIYIPDYKQEPLTIKQEAAQAAQKLVTEFGEALRKGLKKSKAAKPVEGETLQT